MDPYQPPRAGYLGDTVEVDDEDVIEFTPTAEEIADGMAVVMLRHAGWRRWWNLLVGLALAGYGWHLYRDTDSLRPLAFGLLIAGVMLTGIAFAQGWFVRERLRKMVEELEQVEEDKLLRLLRDHDAIEISGHKEKQIIDRDNTVGYVPDDRYHLILRSRRLAQVIPKRLLGPKGNAFIEDVFAGSEKH